MIGVGRFIGIGVNRFRAGASYPAVLDDGNTVAWFDSTKNITKDGSDFVSVWGDKSGLSHDLLQASGTNQPLWSADGVLFDGVDNFMKCNAFTLVQPEMIYILFKQVTRVGIDTIFDGNINLGGALYQRTAPSMRANAGSDSADNTNLPLNTFGVVRILFDGASSKYIIDETTATTGNFGTNDMGGFTLGTRGTGGTSDCCNIQVKEVIIRKAADTAQDESDIYEYLKKKLA